MNMENLIRKAIDPLIRILLMHVILHRIVASVKSSQMKFDYYIQLWVQNWTNLLCTFGFT